MARHNAGLVCGWGLSDLKTEYKGADGQRIRCPFSTKWSDMVMRVHSEKYLQKMPSYIGCSITNDWQRASTFKVWMEGQIWQGLELDKDILFVGNKIYSPETCAFIPKYVNYCFLTKQGGRGDCPLGVTTAVEKRYPGYVPSNPYVARVNDGLGNYLALGRYAEQMDAHRAWQLAKADVIENTVLRYMLEPCYRQDVANAIYLRAEMLRDDHANHRETFSL